MEQQQELVEKCTWTVDTLNGVEGYRVTGPNGNSIFLPAAGGGENPGDNDDYEYGVYWSRTLYSSTSNSYYACYMGLVYYSNQRTGYTLRWMGLPIRAVRVY